MIPSIDIAAKDLPISIPPNYHKMRSENPRRSANRSTLSSSTSSSLASFPFFASRLHTDFTLSLPGALLLCPGYGLNRLGIETNI